METGGERTVELKLRIGVPADLSAVYKPYKAECLRTLWRRAKNGDGPIGSGEMWRHLGATDYPGKDPNKKNVSRASVIFVLNELVDEGASVGDRVADFQDATGKGGHHRLYFSLMDEKKFWEWFAQQVVDTLAAASGGIIPKLPLFSDPRLLGGQVQP